MWSHREMDFIQWPTVPLWSLLHASGKKSIQRFLSLPLEGGVLYLLNLTMLRTGPGEEGEHINLLPNGCFGKY